MRCALAGGQHLASLCPGLPCCLCWCQLLASRCPGLPCCLCWCQLLASRCPGRCRAAWAELVRLIEPDALRPGWWPAPGQPVPGVAVLPVLVASSWPGWCFATNERAASACPARPRGRFALKRCSTQSSTSPGQPLARQAMAAPGAFWWPALGRDGAPDRARCAAPWLVASTWPACARGCRAACAGGQLLAGLVFCYQ